MPGYNTRGNKNKFKASIAERKKKSTTATRKNAIKKFTKRFTKSTKSVGFSLKGLQWALSGVDARDKMEKRGYEPPRSLRYRFPRMK